jgi:exopolyphosphatase / guanosine-5'-triphosphate,3'-diphosphate pyrophosphatase
VKLATIDVGTNTTLLLVAEATATAEAAEGAAPDVHVLADRAEITRLGRGIGSDGRLGAEGITRTLAVLEQYAREARAHGAEIAAVGTEALRRAPNAGEFLEPAAAILGGPIEVIAGQREADLTFRAAASSFPALAAGPLMVIDIGGGSTEVIVAEAGEVRARDSLPLGSVRLTERHVHHDPATGEEIAALVADVQRTLAGVPARASGGGPLQLVGTAGTVTTLAGMALALASYDAARVHGYRLTLPELEAQTRRLATSMQAEREKMVGLDPRRADVILAGAQILLAFVRRLDAPSLVVNDRGIRWGLLYERLAHARPRQQP